VPELLAVSDGVGGRPGEGVEDSEDVTDVLGVEVLDGVSTPLIVAV
jgi:hypothetical protein